jgi:glycosyltransferase involved in cell wall biosynthesis
VRIGVDCRPLATPRTGIGRYLKELLGHMPQSGHEWFFYSDRPIAIDAAPPHTRREGRISAHGLSAPFAQVQFARWANADHVDVFWSPRHHLPYGLAAPSVVTIHDLVWRKCPRSMIRLGWLAERLFMPSALARARFILTPSSSTARDVIEYKPDTRARIRVVPLAAELVRTEANPPPTLPPRPYALVVGTIEPRKNHGRILDAFDKLIVDASIAHHLVVVGNEGWKSTDVLRRLRASSARVHYVGTVEDRELAWYYQNADFVVAPSLYEGFGLQVLEAMSFGKAIITSDLSSMPEVAGCAALLVEPLSVDSIANAMRSLALDRPLRERLGQCGRARAERFSWHSAAESTLQVILSAAR